MNLPARKMVISPDPAALALSLAQDLAHHIQVQAERRSEDTPVEIAIAGGFVATTVLPALAQAGEGIDWSKVRFWWCDERFVPAGDPDRNDEEAHRFLLDRIEGVRSVPMPTDNGQGLAQACEDFTEQWNTVMATRSLDVAVLGMGPDGHIASLFPGMYDPAESRAIIAVDDSPKPPPQRLSLSMPVILSTQRLYLAAAGEAKAGVLGAAFAEGVNTGELPVAALRHREDTRWYLDEAAAAEL
ncbi:6-phosphogluconolactonase [Schaalia sp. Marseille-Q2122]|uniref:6-phosphogluconolactonase n=1 Tax=Schaalia sp. Marseille-Q2122 TaxID=2736604 RepID=UPI00158DFACB|nr:6-phosphogluconolactonase [Schaalia sp. Marseille-Q2122]